MSNLLVLPNKVIFFMSDKPEKKAELKKIEELVCF